MDAILIRAQVCARIEFYCNMERLWVRDLNLAREANTRIADAARDLDIEGKVPFLCECRDGRCAHFVLLLPDEFDDVRARPELYIVSRGHEDVDAEHIVDGTASYVLTEKL
jgi:hypothetical protein